jgi:hypothetical protein
MSDDWNACQTAAAVIRVDGRGVVAPSAALRGAVNITLFGPRRVIEFDRRPALASAVPGAITAIGRPPTGLLNRVERRVGFPTLFQTLGAEWAALGTNDTKAPTRRRGRPPERRKPRGRGLSMSGSDGGQIRALHPGGIEIRID